MSLADYVSSMRAEWLQSIERSAEGAHIDVTSRATEAAENIEERRIREKAIRKEISDWFVTKAVSKTSNEHLVCIDVVVAPYLPKNIQSSTISMNIPHAPRGQDLWRPRASSLIWCHEPYRNKIFRVYLALCDNISFESPLYGALSPSPTSQQIRYGAQSIERAMITVYYGIALAQTGKIKVPEPTVTTSVVGRFAAPTEREKSASYTRLYNEKMRAKEIFERTRGASLGLPIGPGAVDRMTDAYIYARLAQPSRGSQLTQVAVRLACYIYVLAPHLVPIAPSSGVGAVIATRSHDAWLDKMKESDVDVDEWK